MAQRGRERWVRWSAVGAILAANLVMIGSAGAAGETTPGASDAPARSSTFAGPNQEPAAAGPSPTYTGVDGVLADERVPKAEGLGPIGRPARNSPDVPGQDPSLPEADLPTPIVTPAGPSAGAAAEVRRALAGAASTRVNVTLRPPPGLAAGTTGARAAQDRAAIAASLDALEARLSATGSQEVGRLSISPWATYQLTAAGLDALLADGTVTSINLDRPVAPALASSTEVIQSAQLNLAGVLGNNFEGSSTGSYEVAIIDSGVDIQHSAFAGRIVAEACFSAGSDCPNGTTSQTGGGAGDNCTYAARCDHGTHTASIAAGSFFDGGHEGVARGAGIVSVQVGSQTTSGWTAQFSDINLALQHVLNLKNGGRAIVAVNLSLFIPGFVRNAACDSENGDFANTQNLAANLVAAGVAVIAAAGNDNGVGVSYPACLTSVFGVSATTDADVPSGSTNSGVLTDWWAPGAKIDAATPGTATSHVARSGTSTAAPHVTGSFALLRECVDGNGVPISNAAAVSRLNATGVDVVDNGASRKRINVLDAATGLVNNNDFASPEVLPASGAPFNDFDFTVCSDAEPGEPGPFSVDNGVWWTWTPTNTGTATISTEDNGSNVTTFDTTLAVYTGSTLATLETIAFDDDSGTGLRSLVTVPVNGGTTYRIKVDGFAAANGLLNLHIENNAPPACGGVAATIVGYATDDEITGTAGNDVIVAGAGIDVINSLGGEDRVCGDAGDDTITAGLGNDVVFGGPGADIINGSDGNDTLLGNAGSGDTDDVGDVISGDAGSDLLDGWVGDDVLIGGRDPDMIRGEAGVDTADYTTSPNPIVANLATNTATGNGTDTFVFVENVTGSLFDDSLTGDAGPNVLLGLKGDDTIVGNDGPDDLRGGNGNDTVNGGLGDDLLDGGLNTDTVTYESAAAGVTVNLAAGTATGDGADTLANFENADGSPSGDTIDGTNDANRLRGFDGRDTIRGADGPDLILGGEARDDLRGGSGADELRGEAGNDDLAGGEGTDTCNGGGGTDTASTCETVTGVP